MANLSHIRSKAEFIDNLRPAAWEAAGPLASFVSAGAQIELLVADAVRTIAFAIADESISRRVLVYSREMAKQAVNSLSVTHESGYETCPPWPWPWTERNTWPVAAPSFGVESTRAAEHLELARILAHLAGLTTSPDHNRTLRSFAAALREKFELCEQPRAMAAPALLP
ncbi:MAG TPA: hypothetical protein VFQ91_28490 [Bryobacteraceae bacterium]|nr:hypothetical protein [Bryobacteraceae bacterium]